MKIQYYFQGTILNHRLHNIKVSTSNCDYGIFGRKFMGLIASNSFKPFHSKIDIFNKWENLEMTFWSVDESMAVAEQQRSVHNWIFFSKWHPSLIFSKKIKKEFVYLTNTWLWTLLFKGKDSTQNNCAQVV